MIINIGKTNVIFSDEALKILMEFKQVRTNMTEAGGILFGQYNGTDFFITKASTPNKFDKATRYTFTRDKDAAQIIVNYEFINSHGKTIYIGEWHTHPEDIPTPSGQDLKMIKEQFQKSQLNEPLIFLVIVGLQKTYIGIYSSSGLSSNIL